MAKRTKKPSLKTYRAKRDFAATPEPAGKKTPPAKEPVFVVQKHLASHLHYDFRLEIGGVLVSWAIPKGPSMDPGVKRLAMRTEDHPLEYASFEGVIPEGQYGAGTVMIWDAGTFTNIKKDKSGRPVAIEEALAQGRLTFELSGRKLRGAFALNRTNFAGRESWILLKMKDPHAATADILQQDRSVRTGRTLDEITAGK